jgi:6-phosphofructo-2-kinase/fructose-2,6-biphosphatase 4
MTASAPRSSRRQIWTSARRRAHHTAWPFIAAADPKQPGGSRCNVKVIEKPQMSEINPGVWDGLTPDQARKYYSEEWERFVKDPYSFRAPRAESYHDLSGTYPIMPNWYGGACRSEC